MGFLFLGTPLKWKDSLECLEYVRKHGIIQFLNTIKRAQEHDDRELLWGDEVEYHVVAFDDVAKTVKVTLRSAKILEVLEEATKHSDVTYHPEFGSWMIETTPKKAYCGFTDDLIKVEKNMRIRRVLIRNALKPSEALLSLVAFPLLGVGEFTVPPCKPMGPVGLSDCIPDECVNPHPRFACLVRNIRTRRGSKVSIKAPVYQDTLTAVREIEMDHQAFGMGMCCLQVTFQAKNMSQSRHLYDQLAVLGPVFLALTAGCPIMKGHLVNTDARWNYIQASVDDRTPQERGVAPSGKPIHPAMAGGGVKRLMKSRYGTISCYICNHKGGTDPLTATNQYNDIPCEVNEDVRANLVKHGLDSVLARHIAHLWTRDPLVIYKERLNIDDEKAVDHFENIQSTNWQAVRWKPPPYQASDSEEAAAKASPKGADEPPAPAAAAATDAADAPATAAATTAAAAATTAAASKAPDSKAKKQPSGIGWRTEFRTMEVQMTDFENAAFTVFIAILSRAVLAFDLNLYVPLSKLDENMNRAHMVQAVTKEKFYFRRHVAPPASKSKTPMDYCCAPDSNYNGVELMTIEEILNGKGRTYPGLIPIAQAYLDAIHCDPESRAVVNRYLEFINLRATGELMTAATWMREFVHTHKDYKHDSVVPQSVAYDLLKRCHAIGEGRAQEPKLYGTMKLKPLRASEAEKVVLAGEGALNKMGNRSVINTIERYRQRGMIREKRRRVEKVLAEKQKEIGQLMQKIARLDQQEESLFLGDSVQSVPSLRAAPPPPSLSAGPNWRSATF